MNAHVSQKEVNDAVWNACDTFRGVVDPSIYKDYVLTILFLKYITDVWLDHYNQYKEQHGDHPELIEELMKNERFVLPKQAGFYYLYDKRFEPGNGERIDKALHAIEETNLNKLGDVFQDISFNSTRLGDDKQKNDLLRHMLEDFNKPELNLQPMNFSSSTSLPHPARRRENSTLPQRCPSS
jgi:type I restriction enzyme M protein